MPSSSAAPRSRAVKGTRAERRRQAAARAHFRVTLSQWRTRLFAPRPRLPRRPRESWGRRLRAQLEASRIFTCSLALHVALVLFVGSAVLIQRVVEPADFAPEGGSGLVTEDVAGEPPPPAAAVETPVYTPSPTVTASPQLDAIVTNSVIVPTFQLAAPAPAVRPAIPDLAREVRKLPPAAIGQGATTLPVTMAGRFGGVARMALMQRNKMSLKSEKAVQSGLQWLKLHQNKDGSWGQNYRTAMTGLAVLCFLGHGETPKSRDFGATVTQGVEWLLQRGVKAKGALAGSGESFDRIDVYEHAIGVYALAEYFSITHDQRVKDVLAQGVIFIVDGQGQDGGWQYSYLRDGNSDTSVSGWQIQALKAAHLTGLNIRGIDESLDRAMVNLRRVQNDEGAFGYRDRNEPRYNLTGVGVLCTYFWKGQLDDTVRKGIKYILTHAERDEPVDYKAPGADLYAWYYDTQACLMVGGEAWTKWNGWFQSQITNNENPDGSWPPTGNRAPIGGLESDPQGDGPCYRTALCVLMLEVYYRYMPTTR